MRDPVRTIFWKGSCVYVLDQRALPARTLFIRCAGYRQVGETIRNMALRGAPLIGCAAAYAMALAALQFSATLRPHKSPGKESRAAAEFIKRMAEARNVLISARPTAVHLSLILDRMLGRARNLAQAVPFDAGKSWKALKSEAERVVREDIQSNLDLSRHGAKLLPHGAQIITYCNAGALATGGWGTALGVVRQAFKIGKLKKAFACETRPYLQGSRLTLWELMQNKIPCALITDNMAGYLMGREKIHAIIVGADRIARNGDTANKIGTFTLAALARYHRVPFYVAAATSTIDMKLAGGKDIPIEQRSPKEVVEINGRRIAPRNAQALHPAFDVTPHALITAFITEKGILHPPFKRAQTS